MMKTTSEILRAAADLIDKGWTQGAYARNATGASVGPHDTDAVCFCALGAISRAVGTERYDAVMAKIVARSALRVEIGNVVPFNDKKATCAADVSGAMRRAADMMDKRAAARLEQTSADPA